MYTRPTFLPEAAFLPEATFPWDLPSRSLSHLCIAELYEHTSIRVYERIIIRACEQQPNAAFSQQYHQLVVEGPGRVDTSSYDSGTAYSLTLLSQYQIPALGNH